MRRYRFLHALIIVLTMTAVVRSQEVEPRHAVGDQGAREGTVATREEQAPFDDDGGRVFIVKRDAGIQDGLRYHGGAVISAPRQYNIFLGSGWADRTLRGREKSFSNLLQTSGADAAQGLARYGVQNIFLPSQTIEQPFEFSPDWSVSDLRIQSVLAEMFSMGAVLSPSPDAIYVLFLPPGVNSKLGSMIGGKHYAAYHNFFHAEQGEVHYVVVPFEPDVKTARSVAARAVSEAAMNPAGDGWY
jgi:hypothetical protein